MKITLTAHWEGFVRQLIDSGCYNNASEVVRTALRKLQETEGKIFPAGSLKDLNSKEANAAECELAKRVRMPKPDDVFS
jgi:putative addiction module CopG family antidote